MDEFSTTFSAITPKEPTPVPFVNTPLANFPPPSGANVVILEETANG